MEMINQPGLIRTISPQDDMSAGQEDVYFAAGESALQQIQLALQISGKKSCSSILDFPCGSGRVLRHLKLAYPEATLTACDLLENAVDFCVETFGARGVYSQKDLSKVVFTEKFDLIWCGSLLTHLDSYTWPMVLKLFSRSLTEDGVVVFTTHGRWVAWRLDQRKKIYGLAEKQVPRVMKQYKRSGFGYADYGAVKGYGVSVSSPSFVMSSVEKEADLKIIHFSEKGWHNHQDVVACTRETDIFPTASCAPRR